MALTIDNVSDVYLRIFEEVDGRREYVATLYGSVEPAAVWAHRLTRAYNLLPEVIDVLNECAEYFDDRADADCVDGAFRPNEAMRRHQDVTAILEKLNRLLQLKSGDPHAQPPRPQPQQPHR